MIENPSSAVNQDLGYETQLWHGVQDVFEMMVGTTLTRCPEPQPIAAQFTAMIGIAGPLCGLLSIHCSKQAALLIASRMLGVPLEEAGPQAWDAMGEVCNMVAGSFKAKLGEVGESSMLSVPSVVSGRDYRLRPMISGIVTELRLQFDDEPIWFRLQCTVDARREKIGQAVSKVAP
ncbi:MAG: chemotaxis protein CheX [Candidatus Korobacteraceae bacterium]|jgi:chemotaxis protein CheX